MFYNYYQTNQYEYDECVSKGICSMNPTLSSLQEVILLHLKELAYYLIELKKLGVANEAIRSSILDALSGIATNAEYAQDQFQDVTTSLYSNLSQAKALYINLCEKHNIKFNILKTYFKHSKTFDLSETIKKGEKHFLKKMQMYTTEQKNLFDVMVFLVKSVCIKIIELKNLGKDYDEAYYGLLTILNKMNFLDFDFEDVKAEIENFVGIYYELVKQVYYTQIELYGEMVPVDVSFSTRPGKAILVAGSDLKELELILKAAEKEKIDVYTHGIEMLMAHTFPKLKAYKNLVGHFGKGIDNCLIDFATFPGAILMTKHSLEKVEYLYRGRLFTTDLVASKGVVKLKDNNFEPLIKSALEAKGFARGQQRSSIKVGYNETEIMKKVNDVMDKLENGEIKHLFIVGMLNYAIEHNQYFDKFFSLLPKDCFAFSLSYDVSRENVYHINSFYEYSLAYKIIKELSLRKPINEIKMSVFLTKCDKHTIANLLNFKRLGIKSIYMCKCSPVLVNPALINALRNLFNIHEFSDPKTDMENAIGTT